VCSARFAWFSRRSAHSYRTRGRAETRPVTHCGWRGPITYSSLVAVVVELHNVGALLDALQLVEFFVQNVASGADVV
jgi:hypothetical protein